MQKLESGRRNTVGRGVGRSRSLLAVSRSLGLQLSVQQGRSHPPVHVHELLEFCSRAGISLTRQIDRQKSQIRLLVARCVFHFFAYASKQENWNRKRAGSFTSRPKIQRTIFPEHETL